MKTFREYLKLLRVKQWTKNGFLFAALIFSKSFLIRMYTFKVFLAFCIFSLLASSIYILNDIRDRDRDKYHPQKRNRPIASGKISIKTGLTISFFLLIISLTSSFALSTSFFEICITYLIINLLYTYFLKNIVILDIFCISAGFLLRVLAGAAVISVSISQWLIICTILLSLFLALSKRKIEITLISKNESDLKHREILGEYSHQFIDQMIGIVTSTTLISYILYTTSGTTIKKFGTTHLIYTTPFVLYGIFRYLYLVYSKERGGNPTDEFLSDIPLLINAIFWLITSAIIITFF